MNNKIFIDTSAFYAINDKTDKNNKTATKIYTSLLAQNSKFTLTDHILSETATLLRRRLGYRVSDNFVETILEGEAVGLFQIYFTNSSILKLSHEYFVKFPSDKISFTDTVSFATMIKHNIKSGFAFDNHFIEAGFDLAS